jgi:SAM-dependent methyltransferase
MNSNNYKDFYDRVGSEIGWDFSSIKCVSEELSWDFYTEVSKHCKPTDLLLDIGIGGGEKVLEIAKYICMLIGIDMSSGMIKTAKKNLSNSDVSNVKFFEMHADKLQFPDNFFDIISSRQSDFYVYELVRVLEKGGMFLTQQVSEHDKLNIKAAFHKGQSYGERDGAFKERYIKKLKDAGFSEVSSFDYDVKEYYQTPEDLLFLLKNAPIIPNFGVDVYDFDILEKFISENITDKGIMTNSKRYMIIAKK